MNTFITPTWVTKDTALNFNNELTFLNQCDRQWDDSFMNKPQGAQIGDTVNVRIQQRWEVSEGQALQQQSVLNQTVPITVNKQFQVGMGWSSAQTALEVEEVQERYTIPAGAAQASKWDSFAANELYKTVAFSIGSPGVPNTNNRSFLGASALLRKVAVPDGFCAVMEPDAMADIANANFALFNPAAKVGQMFEKGYIASNALSIKDWYTDALMPAHTTGTFTTSTPVTSSAGQTGSSLAISGMGTFALKEGDVFTVAGVYAVNPVAYTNTRILQQFVLTADVAGSSTATLSISPSIITSGQLQTVTAAPANGAALTFLGSTGTVAATMSAIVSNQSLIFNPAAFAFVMVDLPDNLAGANAKRVNSKKQKLSMRWVEQYNIQTDQQPSRCDTIGGVATILPYFAVRAWS